jgi:hypothetical protein
MLNGAFITFQTYHGKRNIGSTRIRAEWVMKYWPESIGTVEEFVQGKEYDFVVYQKVYWTEHAKEYKGIKILDLCDADWYDWQYPIVEMIQYMDAITTSTQMLKEAVEKMVRGLHQQGYIDREIPVTWIDDRMDPDFHKERKKFHDDEIRRAVWMGYSHNLKVLDAVMPSLKARDIELTVISNGMHARADKHIPWTLETVNQDMIDNADVLLNPRLTWGKWKYKSDNKTVTGWALGIPVVRTLEELDALKTKEAREQEAKRRLELVNKRYHPKLSAFQYVKIVSEAIDQRENQSQASAVPEATE